jgi:hypothetical protein
VRLKPLGHLSDAANNLTNLAESLSSRTLASERAGCGDEERPGSFGFAQGEQGSFLREPKPGFK